MSYFRLITNRSKLFCGLTLFGREKNFPLRVLVSCLSLLLGRGGVVFLAAWCVRTRLVGEKASRSGGRCERGTKGDVCYGLLCTFFFVGGEIPAPLFSFFEVLPYFEHFCAQFLWKRQCATAHKPVCVGLTCKGEGGKCQNKKRL